MLRILTGKTHLQAKLKALTGSMNMDVWEIDTLIQLFIYLLKFNFKKKDG